MVKCIGPLLLSALLLIVPGCGQDTGNKGRYKDLDKSTKIRLKQYLAEGKRLYKLHCSNCHQEEGTGLAKLYPPLKNSDYLLTNRREVICGMRLGQKGEITVNGIVFNQPMPENPKITDLEIAEIATYVYNTFADTVQLVTVQEVREILSNCPDHMKINRSE
jgi:mono/diheme cytochrome c family protein